MPLKSPPQQESLPSTTKVDCEAKKICASKSEILAPITNRADFDALYRVTQQGNNPSCPFHYGSPLYSIGLDVTPCGTGKQDRVFTNGVVWNNTVHGKLYSESSDSRTSPCVHSLLDTSKNKPLVRSYSSSLCRHSNPRFICLKEESPSQLVSSDSCVSSASPEAVSSEDGSLKWNLVGTSVVAFLSLAAVVSAFVAVKYYKRYRAIEEKHEEMKNHFQLKL